VEEILLGESSIVVGGKEQWVPIDTFLTALRISSYASDSDSALGSSKPTSYRGALDPCARDADLPPGADWDMSSSSSLESSRDPGALSLCLLSCAGEGSVAAEDEEEEAAGSTVTWNCVARALRRPHISAAEGGSNSSWVGGEDEGKGGEPDILSTCEAKHTA